MRTAVIFGGMGFIGIHFAKHLLNQSKNDLIYLIDISEPKDQYCINIYENLKSNNKIKIIIKDIKKDLTNIEISQVDTIYDFAAVHREPGHIDSEYFETNVVGSKNICKFADHYKCKNIIFTSSISVYGPGNYEKTEDSETLPNTAYGKSKLKAENNYLNWQSKNKNEKILTICRPGVVFGAGESGNVTRLIKTIKKGFFFLWEINTLKNQEFILKN